MEYHESLSLTIEHNSIMKNFEAIVMKMTLTYASPQFPIHNPMDRPRVANRIMLNGLNKRVERFRNTWAAELLPILCAYRTTCKVTTQATPFLLPYGTETVVPIEISHTSPRITAFELEANEEGMKLALDLIDEVRDKAHAKIIEYQKRTSSYCNLRG